MCGIFGVASKLGVKTGNFQESLAKMSHRGPDQTQTWKGENVFLGHVRLSINDLSENGMQPMQDDEGIIVFNGEIYNYKLLKEYLEETHNCTFTSDSDTEVLLKLLGIMPIEDVLNKIEGMFAFAYISFKDNTLYLSRDFCGEKPLFVYQDKETIVFSSEQKSIIEYLGHFAPSKNIKSYLQRGYFTNGQTSLIGCIRLKPNSILKVDLDTHATKEQLNVVQLKQLDRQHPTRRFDSAVLKLEDLLFDTVEKMLEADVPVCTFLSGGVDSSLITAIAAKINKTSIESYTIGFQEKKFDESEFAENVANHLGVNLHKRIVNGEDALAALEGIPRIYDEPISDPSVFPTLLLCDFASKKYKVALTGDGADEVFLGYSRYNQTVRRFTPLDSVPRLLKMPAGLLISATKRSALLNRISDYLLKSDNLALFYEISTNKFATADLPMLTAFNSDGNASPIERKIGLSDSEYLAKIDFHTYMVDDVLVKVDRAAMNYSLETRAPFLSKNVIEFADNIPSEFKSNLESQKSKYILKQILQRHIPDSLINRPKRGFAAPIASWLRGDLYDWALKLLNESEKFDTAIDIAKLKRQFYLLLKGEARFADGVWTALVYLNWVRHYSER